MNLSKFFEEKQINYQSFEIVNSKGEVHYLDTDVVIEYLMNTKGDSRKKVKRKLLELDFYNAPIEPFLKYVAKFMVNQL